MYLGYCHSTVDKYWTPPVHLESVEVCFRYCLLHHGWAQEIRITDADDFCILHVKNHVLKVPMPDGTFHEMMLS